jgi:hypothetical protein
MAQRPNQERYMTEQDTPSLDLTDYEWELDGRNVYANWRDGRHTNRALVAQFTDSYLANQAVVAQHLRLESARERPKTLAQDIAAVLNRHSMENASNTPDFLLAEYMERAMSAAEIMISRRDAWYGVSLTPGPSVTAPTR